MAGAIEKKKNETFDELEGSPTTHIDARSSILSEIALSREFAQTFLHALCKKFTSSSGDYSLSQICENLASQRAICYGARDLKNSYKKFTLPSYETVNGTLTLTEANTSFFGYVATTLDEKTTITLSNSTTATQTVDGNTFSTYIGDYYLVRSRISGELEPTTANLSAYTTPDGADIVFGNAVAWGSSVAGEEEANTWNYNWARANVASVAVKNSGNDLELNTLTLSDHLTQGSNTDYTPVGPGFNQSFYLKRHADAVDTFTITGTTTVNSVSITAVSEADMAKVKYGDVISGTGIPDDNVSILAVQTEKNTLRLSETGVATADGTITLTVNSVPVGQAAHDIFCQVKVSAEGLVANTSWTPVGDDAGNYTTGSEDDLCVANTTQFTNLLSFFNPNDTSNDLSKGASAKYVSDGKEYNSTNYPDIELNTFFPSNAGTTKEYTVKNGEVTGTQPSPLGNKDIWCGRFVRFDNERANAGGPVSEYRYLIDNAEKFFYELPSTAGYVSGSTTIAAFGSMPSNTEPPIVIQKTGLASATAAIQSNQIAISGGVRDSSWGNSGTLANTAPDVIPPDTDTTRLADGDGGVSGAPNNNDLIGYYYTVATDNFIMINRYYYTNVQTTSFSWSADTASDSKKFNCKYNYALKKLYEGASQNIDVQFIKSTIDDLRSIASFRDPITTGAAAGTNGISDSVFDSSLDVQPVTAWMELEQEVERVRSQLNGQGRTGADNADTDKGINITFNSTKWHNYHTQLTIFGSNCNKRITEIDKRIGVPTRTGGGVGSIGGGVAPTGRISAIPASPAEGEYIPYGRSIYNNINYLLGQDINLLGGIIKDIEALTDLVDMVKTARNKYEIFSGRDKVY